MKKNSLSTAIIAGVAGVAGLAGMANAVNVNPDGLGQVLLYPYYTVNGGNVTLLSVVNTTERDKAVKVRFLEALNSAEVLDFNLYLSEFDVWTASLVSTPNGASLFTSDTSCTVPNGVGSGAGTAFVPFEFQAGGNNPDYAGITQTVRLNGSNAGTAVAISDAERMRQGHVEMIEMGDLFDGTGGFLPATWTTHLASTLRPANCGALQAAFTAPGGRWLTPSQGGPADGGPGRALNAPSGGLFGGGVIVDVAFGRALTYNAEAIAGFYSPAGLVEPAGLADPGTVDLHTFPGSVQPDLGRARTGTGAGGDFARANIFEPSGVVVSATFAGDQFGVNAVSAALMSRFMYNEFNIEAGLSAATEWVVTFPTKRKHTYGRIGLDVRPFSDNVNSDAVDDNTPFDRFGLCEVYGFTNWDREESPGTPTSTGPIVSPPPPPGTPTAPPSLCWESNIIAFNQTLAVDTPTLIFGAQPKQGAHALTLPAARLASGNFGWARIQFDNPGIPGFQNYLVSQDANPVAIVGLPVIGFWAADYSNAGAAAGVRANYSQIHKHRLGRDGYLLDATPVPAFGTALPSTGLRSWTQQAAPVAGN